MSPKILNSVLQYVVIGFIALFNLTSNSPDRVTTKINIPYVENKSYERIPYEVFDGLYVREGCGDDVTDVDTGCLGVTKSARKAVKAPESFSDSDVTLAYLVYLESRWHSVTGFSQAPTSVQRALLDTSYNVGERVLRWRGVKRYLKNRNYEGLARGLLDTATVGGKSVRGLAKRRAEVYNEMSSKRIIAVEQRSDGTLIYHGTKRVIFKYTPRGGRHEKSAVGVLYLPNVGV